MSEYCKVLNDIYHTFSMSEDDPNWKEKYDKLSNIELDILANDEEMSYFKERARPKIHEYNKKIGIHIKVCDNEHCQVMLQEWSVDKYLRFYV